MAEHEGLKNLYEQVIDGKFGWDRWGLLSILSDYVMNYNHDKGGMMEIGCGESTIIFSRLANKYKVWCWHIEYSKSGVENMRNTEGYFDRKYSLVYTGKSDDFFKEKVSHPLALAFIDGDHEYKQVERDFDNVWKYIVPGGYVFLHDTLPPDDSWKVPEKCGTVYKLRKDLESFSGNPGYEIFTFDKSAFNVGLTMVKKW